MTNGNNGNRTLGALNTLADTPLGKLILSLVVWAIGTAFAAGYIRSEVSAMKEQINRLEAKVDALGRTTTTYRAP